MISLANRIYGTHLPPLLRCLQATTGPVLEVGCGEWSTPVLQAWCLATYREFLSVEPDPQWAAQMSAQTGLSIMPPDWSYVLASPWWRWSVVLIDHNPPEARIPDALRFAHAAELVVLHDPEYPEIAATLTPEFYASWRYHQLYDALTPQTLVLSNAREIPCLTSDR